MPSPYLLGPSTVLPRNPVKWISKMCATGEADPAPPWRPVCPPRARGREASGGTPDPGVSFFLGESLRVQSLWLVIITGLPPHFEMEQSLFLREEAQERLPTSGASLGHLRCEACPSPTALLAVDVEVLEVPIFAARSY